MWWNQPKSLIKIYTESQVALKTCINTLFFIDPLGEFKQLFTLIKDSALNKDFWGRVSFTYKSCYAQDGLKQSAD